jgi:surface antigen
MVRALVITGLVASALAAPVDGSYAAAETPQKNTQCAETPAKKAKKSMFGSLLGSIADSALGQYGGSAGSVLSSFNAGSMLSDAIINLLDCKEQQQAAKATDEAIRGGVGTEVAWTSETRANVSGKSKVTGEEQLADGSQCVTVNDVVIVEGEETTVPKKMCRSPGASGFVKV